MLTWTNAAAGNRTLCDMCNSKAFRKQMRHKQDQKNSEAEAAEEGDGT